MTSKSALPADLPRPPLGGLRHVALNVRDLAASEDFYVQVLGMRVEWRPDADNVYLTSGSDNLALHRAATTHEEPGRLDHIGFMVSHAGEVDAWHAYLAAHGVIIEKPPRTHRDGARSFYCRDPAGTLIQFIHHPPLAGGLTGISA